MNIAIIPARGGSKRIPRKNIRSFCGQPLIAYSIQVAIRSNLFDQVIVTTEDKEIAEQARLYGAVTPFVRPQNIADDYSTTNDVMKHAVKWIFEHNMQPEFICCIYATAPFLQSCYLEEGLKKLQNSDRDFAFGVTSFSFPPQRAIRISQEGYIQAVQPEYYAIRSQDLEKLYHDAGQFYWGRASSFLKNKITYSEISIPIIIPRYLVQDIDTIEDWIRAENMYRILQEYEY